MNLQGSQQLIDQHVVDMIDLCPHCGAKVHIVKLWSDHHTFKNGDTEFYVVFRCKPCKKLVLKTFFFKQNQYSGKTDLEAKGWDEKFPISLDDELSKVDSEHIPEDVLSDYQEALKCKSIGANKASCSMFRRALQNALVNLGADTKLDLIAQINSLSRLPEDIKDWAHQIRIFGNWGAHPDEDKLKDVEPGDVDEVHDFISKFFIFMFIMPNKVAASRAKRDERLKKKVEESEDE
jgi:hypothetical protein